tara:strand:- start:2225 stop:3034 length:810 start_codon:yes stop_codon:yes gene_type:complete
MNIVIGSSLEALAYAFVNDYKIIYTRLQKPDMLLGKHNFLNREYDALELWQGLYYILGITGNLLYGDKIENIRVEEDSLIVFSKRARKYSLNVTKIFIVDDYQVAGLPSPQLNSRHAPLEVRDWLHVKSGMRHDHDILHSSSKFVNKLVFYPSPRIVGRHNLKDAVAISYLSLDDLDQEDYSEVNARFKALYIMKEAGIRGRRNGRDSKNPTIYKHYAIQLEFYKREIIEPLKPYPSSDRIVFNYLTWGDIIKMNMVDSDAQRFFRKYY